MAWWGTAGHGGAWCGMVRAFRLEKQGLSHATADGLGGRVEEETAARCGAVWCDEEVMIIRPSILSSIRQFFHAFIPSPILLSMFLRSSVRSFVRSFVCPFVRSFVH
jgi:hypothetical protein